MNVSFLTGQELPKRECTEKIGSQLKEIKVKILIKVKWQVLIFSFNSVWSITMPDYAYNHHQHYQPPAMWSNHVLDPNWTETETESLATGPCRCSSHASINVTPRALHLKIDDNNLLHLPEGVWPAPIAGSPVGRVETEIALDRRSWLRAVTAPTPGPLPAPAPAAAAVFNTIYTKCRSFWRFAFVADRLPTCPPLWKSATVCTLPMQKR